MAGAITDVPGITVGHYTDRQAATGCTVILCHRGVLAGVDVRGSAPGTREIDTLRPLALVGRAHAILLTGGSAFGLEAAGGVMQYLEERGYGYDTRVARVPIVPAAVIFDLGIGDPRVRPGGDDGYKACLAVGKRVDEGSVGAGTGATVGKILGQEWATKGGVGTASRSLGNGAIVGAPVVVNAFGDVIDPRRGQRFLNTTRILQRTGTWQPALPTSTRLDRDGVNKLAQMAQDGLARAIRPCHTLVDGDVIFALSLGQRGRLADINALGAVAAEVVAESVVRGVLQAEGLASIPAAREIKAD